MLPGCPTWPEDFARRYREAGYWRGETFGAMLRARAAEHPERVAVVDERRALTYGELDARADRLAAGLRERGIAAQDRVVVQLPNIAEFFEVCFALFRLGAVPVFALPSHRLTEIAYFCEFSAAAAYITCDVEAGFDHRELAAEVRGKVPELPRVFIAGDPGSSGFPALSEVDTEPSDLDGPDAGDIAFLQLSGGSTGVPKLIPRTHDDYIYSFRASNEICGVTAETVYLAALPIAHNFPMSSPGTFGVLHAGGRVVLARRPSPDEVFPLIERERVTLTAAVPPLALVWLDAAAGGTEHDLSSLRVLGSVGEPINPEAWIWYRKHIGGDRTPIVDTWWQTETGAIMISPLPGVTATKPGSAQVPLPGISAKVVDEQGEEVGAGGGGLLVLDKPWPSMLRGIWGDDQRFKDTYWSKFADLGYYFAGDGAKYDTDGDIWLLGRVDDVMNVSGHRISTTEVESALVSHETVAEAAVVGASDPTTGQGIVAFVILRGNAAEGSGGEEAMKALRDHVAREIGPIAKPRQIMVVQELPKTRSGKIMRRLLRDVAENREVGDVSTLAVSFHNEGRNHDLVISLIYFKTTGISFV